MESGISDERLKKESSKRRVDHGRNLNLTIIFALWFLLLFFFFSHLPFFPFSLLCGWKQELEDKMI